MVALASRSPAGQAGRPPPEVLDAWGLTDVTEVPGGQGTAYGTEDLVLKPVVDRHEAEWLALTLQGLPRSSTLRIIRPVSARNNAWVVAGWSAWERLAGAAAPQRWREALEVSDRFHSLVARVPWSDAIGRHTPWALADSFAWAEDGLAVPAVVHGAVTELVQRRTPVDLPRQLVHGDLCGNVLFDEALPPAVIDVSPYWRPRRYAEAILLIDAVAWHGAGEAALGTFADPIDVQVLIRALLFRLGAAAIVFHGSDDRLKEELLAYEPVLRTVVRLSGRNR